MAGRVSRPCFIAVVIACIVISVAFVSLLAIFVWREQGRGFKFPYFGYRGQEVCNSLSCAEAALSLKTNMDQRVDPCMNFYEFACGNFKWRTPWTSSASDWSTKYTKRINVRVKKLLEANETLTKVIIKKLATKSRRFYASCLQEKSDADQIKEIIREVGPMPGISSDWNSVTLESLVAKAHRNAYFALFEMGMTLDAKNNTIYRYEILEPGLFAPSQLYMNSSDQQYPTAYKKMFRAVLSAIYSDLRVTRNINVDAILRMEKQFLQMFVKPEDRRDPVKTYNKWTLSDLQKKVPLFNWRKYFTEALDGTGVKLSDSEPLIVTTPKFFNEMNKLIRKNPNLKENLAMLILVQFVRIFQDRLSSKYQTIFKTYEKEVMGSSRAQYRWEYCVSHVNKYMNNLVSRLYVEEYFKSQSMKEVRELMKRIRKAFAARLANNKWMDNPTKRVAQVKLDKLRELIAYPSYIFDDRWMTAELKRLPSGDNFIPDTFFIKRMSRISELALIGKEVDKNSWSALEVIVAPDAAYDPYSNKLYLKVGILMEPLFSKDYPKYLNYGGIGMVVGHEITHGFDDENRQRDANGNLNQWWSNFAIKNFQKEAKCFVDQYSSFSVKSGKKIAYLNGKLTLGENIADNGGLNQAYQAYQSWKKENGEEPKLPELPYTPEQLFFINYAQNWCSAATDAELVDVISGHHSPEQFRVLGVVSNMKEFQEAFQCKKGTKMNRENKCTIWR